MLLDVFIDRFLPAPFFPLRLSWCLLLELEAANHRLIASEGESFLKPSSSISQEIAAGRAEGEMLREQVHRQAEIINQFRQNKRNTGDNCDNDASPGRRSKAGTMASLEEAVDTAEAAAEAAEDEANQLRRRLAESQRELKRMERRLARGEEETRVSPVHGSGAADASAAVDSRLEEENQRLKEENEKLSTELQAFDLEFFEEIEDLKYKYSEASRKLRHYEQADSRQ